MVLEADVMYVCLLQMEEAELRSWIEKLQVRLQACGQDSPQQLQVVLESLVVKKQSLCEMLQSWNSRCVSAVEHLQQDPVFLLLLGSIQGETP